MGSLRWLLFCVILAIDATGEASRAHAAEASTSATSEPAFDAQLAGRIKATTGTAFTSEQAGYFAIRIRAHNIQNAATCARNPDQFADFLSGVYGRNVHGVAVQVTHTSTYGALASFDMRLPVLAVDRQSNRICQMLSEDFDVTTPVVAMGTGPIRVQVQTWRTRNANESTVRTIDGMIQQALTYVNVPVAARVVVGQATAFALDIPKVRIGAGHGITPSGTTRMTYLINLDRVAPRDIQQWAPGPNDPYIQIDVVPKATVYATGELYSNLGTAVASRGGQQLLDTSIFGQTQIQNLLNDTDRNGLTETLSTSLRTATSPDGIEGVCAELASKNPGLSTSDLDQAQCWRYFPGDVSTGTKSSAEGIARIRGQTGELLITIGFENVQEDGVTSSPLISSITLSDLPQDMTRFQAFQTRGQCEGGWKPAVLFPATQ